MITPPAHTYSAADHMQSLTSLLRDRDPRDPLAQAMAALLDSGLIVATRDSAGRFVQMSEVYGDALGLDADVRGAGFLSGQRFFEVDGREIPRSEHPAHVARMSGIAQRNRVLGVRAANGNEVWFQASYLPLEQGPQGWSVLTVGLLLEHAAFAAPEVSAASNAEPLLAFAESVAGRRLSPSKVAGHLAQVVEAVLPDHASCSLLWRRGDLLEVEPVRLRDARASRPVRFAGEAARRWQLAGTYHVPNMRDTDPVGVHVAGEFTPPVRTFALVPAPDASGARIASIGVRSPEPDSLRSEHLSALERLGRLAGAALDPLAA